MHNMEPKTFVIPLNGWGELTASQNISVSNGIKLADTQPLYLNTETVKLNIQVKDFALDECGMFYILTKDEKIVIFDKGNKTYRYITCLELTGAQNIAVTRTNIFILFHQKDNSFLLRCYARINYQLRWEERLVKKNGGDIMDVTGIVADTIGNIYILAKNQIYQYANHGQYIGLYEDILTGAFDIALTQDGNIVCLYQNNGYKIDIVQLSTGGQLQKLQTIFLPIPNDTNVDQLALNKNGTIYVHAIDKDNKEEFITIQQESRFVASGAYITRVFDSRIPQCQWHRIILDVVMLNHEGGISGNVTDNTRVEVSFFAADDKPAPDNTGNNIDWIKMLLNPSDALILEAQGRYICFKIELFSDDQGKYSPYIKSLSVEFPHHSYLRYLPAVYQNDKEGSEFLARYLALFESFLGSTEKKILSSTRYIDADGAPDEFLPWLAQWLSLAYDENWSYDKLRILIKRAPQLYKMRGTREGLEELLNIYLGKKELHFVSGSTCHTVSENILEDEYKRFEDTYVMIMENFQFRQCGAGDMDFWEASIVFPDPNKDKDCFMEDNILQLIFEKEIVGILYGDILRIDITGSSIYSEISEITSQKDITVRIINAVCGSNKNNGTIVKVYKVFPEEVLYGSSPYSFHVLLRPFGISDNELSAIRKLVEREKPAHTEACVRLLEASIDLGLPTYLGINTILSEPVLAVVGEGVLSRDTILTDREPSGQSDVRGRIDIDTKLS